MFFSIITLPLLGSIASGFFGRKIGVVGSQIISSSTTIVTTILVIIGFLKIFLNKIV